MTETITFRTSRSTREQTPVREPETQNDGIIPLALHRAPMEVTQIQSRTEALMAQGFAPGETRAPSVEYVPVGASILPQDGTAERRVAEPAFDSAARPRGRLYLVSRSRGGVGATTFAVNFALGLTAGGRKKAQRVAIVDLDLQFGTVGTSLDLTDKGGLLALAQLDHEPDAHAVRAALQSHESGLSVLLAPRRPVPLDALDAQRVQSIVDALLASHDAVVVDLPPALVDWLEPLLRRAERLFMITDLAVTSVECAKRILDLFREDAPDLRVEVIVGREKKPLFAGRLHREIATILDQPLRYWLSFDPKRARLSLDRGEPLLKMAPGSSWSRGIRKIIGGL